VFSKGWMFSFFLWNRTELGFVREWKVFKTVSRACGHFVPCSSRVFFADSMS
jgi:hypothetical protein